MYFNIRRNLPVWLSVFAGIALWEIAGHLTSPAFLVPFSETLVRLWQLTVHGEFLTQLLDSAELFCTGFILATISAASSVSPGVGAPNDRPSAAARCTASTTAGWAWPRIIGPHEHTRSM